MEFRPQETPFNSYINPINAYSGNNFKKVSETAKTNPVKNLSIPSKNLEGWKKSIIYSIMTDRFCDGEQETTNMDVDKTDLSKYNGGDLVGMKSKMPYLKSIGVDTIWISPTVKNQVSYSDYIGKTTEGYHGYWPIDFEKVDPHQGSMKDLKDLINTAHDNGIKVIMDVVLNHTAWDHPWAKDPAKKDWFHTMGDISDWENPNHLVNGRLWGLPDLAQENPEVTKTLIDNAKWWIDQTGCDGFRLDAVVHIPGWFWTNFCKEIHDYAGKNFIMIGEVFDGRPNVVSKYQSNMLDTLFDMPLYFTIKDVFGQDGNMRKLAERLKEDFNYENADILIGILDNHDVSRFITEAGYHGKDKLKLALAFLMTVNRIPCIYYGTEVGMEGVGGMTAADRPPENRKMMEWNKDPELLEYFKKITNIRNQYGALQSGKLLEMWQDDKVFAYSRSDSKEEIIVGLNNAYYNQRREIPIRSESGIREGTVLINLLNNEEVVVRNGRVILNFDPKEPKILVVKK